MQAVRLGDLKVLLALKISGSMNILVGNTGSSFEGWPSFSVSPTSESFCPSPITVAEVLTSQVLRTPTDQPLVFFTCYSYKCSLGPENQGGFFPFLSSCESPPALKVLQSKIWSLCYCAITLLPISLHRFIWMERSKEEGIDSSW